MDLIPIVPTKYLELIKDNKRQMSLSHLIGKDKVYTDFYKRMATEGKYVIMDNSVVEGEQDSIEDLCSKAMEIGTTEIILPDVMEDSDETLRKTDRALTWIENHSLPLSLMMVPQGKSIDEWLYCYSTMKDWPIDTIGIPKILCKEMPEARCMVLEVLRGCDKVIHLLGCWDNPLELLYVEKTFPGRVRSCDSAIAYAYARKNKYIGDCVRPSVGEKIDFSDTKTKTKVLKENLLRYKRLVNNTEGNVTFINF